MRGAGPAVQFRRLLVAAASAGTGFLLLCTLGYALGHPETPAAAALRLAWCTVPIAATVQFAAAVARTDPATRPRQGLSAIGLGPGRLLLLTVLSTAVSCTLGSAAALLLFLHLRGGLSDLPFDGEAAVLLAANQPLPLPAALTLLTLVPVLASVAATAVLRPRAVLRPGPAPGGRPGRLGGFGGYGRSTDRVGFGAYGRFGARAPAGPAGRAEDRSGAGRAERGAPEGSRVVTLDVPRRPGALRRSTAPAAPAAAHPAPAGLDAHAHHPAGSANPGGPGGPDRPDRPGGPGGPGGPGSATGPDAPAGPPGGNGAPGTATDALDGLPWGAAVVAVGLAVETYAGRAAPAHGGPPLPGGTTGGSFWVLVGWALTAIGLALAGPALAHLSGRLLQAVRPSAPRLLAGRVLMEEATRIGRPLGVVCAVGSGAYALAVLRTGARPDIGPLTTLGALIVAGCTVATLLTAAVEAKEARSDTTAALLRIGAPAGSLRSAAALRAAALFLVLTPLTWVIAQLAALPLTR